jgi:predicted ABC-type transport system involved in lysophospholipase L1 biosynthesis ATPase subunit
VCFTLGTASGPSSASSMFVFQFHHLIAALTAEEDARMPLALERGSDRRRGVKKRLHTGHWVQPCRQTPPLQSTGWPQHPSE